MKVNIQFESTDVNNEVTVSNVNAVMEIRKYDYRLVFVEDLSGDGHKTKSTMIISDESLRIIRTGELNTDFIYGNALVHNTTYGTPYGNLPVTLETLSYAFSVGHYGKQHMVNQQECNTLWIEPDHFENLWGKPELPDDFEMNIAVAYRIVMGSEKPLPMKMKLRITKV